MNYLFPNNPSNDSFGESTECVSQWKSRKFLYTPLITDSMGTKIDDLRRAAELHGFDIDKLAESANRHFGRSLVEMRF